MRRIWLITDFQEGSPYIFQMKGVIYTINPKALIIDITHSVPPHNIEVAAFLLRATVRYVPPGDVIVGVVDPGVGTSRKALVMSTKSHVFVGPDNGLFSLVDGVKAVYEINMKKLREMLGRISTTFHGRDVFAPVAALISLGAKLGDIGRPVKPEEIITLPVELPRIEGNVMRAKVIYIDPFGNIILNVPSSIVFDVMKHGGLFQVRIRGSVIKVPLVETYGKVRAGSPLLLINSFDLLELAINQGNAAHKYNVKIGDEVLISLQNTL